MFEQFTIGVEEEYQIVDPRARELKSHISVMLDEGRMVLGERVKPEMHQSVVEVGTGICQNVTEARRDVIGLRHDVSQLARKNGLAIAAAGTHPFSDWKRQDITQQDRYLEIVEDLQDVARGNLIFGLHVHVGVEHHQQAIELFNQARYFLPHLLALSCSSPFWLGRDTGLKSCRSVVFKRFPRTGIPDSFESWSAFELYLETLIKTGCIDNGKKIWWDLRPHSFYNTIEFRICDLPTTIDTTIALVALVQAIVAKLYTLRLQNMQFREYPRALIEENKWRASRYGLDGKLIDFGKNEEVSTREIVLELMEFVDDVVDHLGSRQEIEYIYKILEHGTDADRQLRIWKESGRDCKAIVDDLIERTMLGVTGPAGEKAVENALGSGSV
ncbi:MAG: carboxylate-amine ligase [Cyanobacteria bacterium NC_groundwater_1444_Ag_S-0.65um_54_12]|nr:carboxylate-amine ligase [Cyanobacteria bacterium NC_groundwater_1444_Ag_S-0.65um_54_12]